ncbi:histidinol dehydrogenase [Shewanella sp. 202IG2-18]|uniref:histidinol dehydrogenase n=1 Tax=Parashewanella hymeniacidonis TaxID=2807618 RepID=UPI001960711F|nr:histidinol dehydrogenase [Parashewanella hymeniacidonis]MBM7072711.1 histidinol dehydrogenase [Parashewanella hymeniacidonis]
MHKVVWSQLSSEQKSAVLQRSQLVNDEALQIDVNDIIQQVRRNGDSTLFELTKKYDGADITRLKVAASEIATATTLLSQELKQAIDVAFNNINAFHRAQLSQTEVIETSPGIKCELRTEAVQSVGLYIPGGTAPLLSTTLMLAIPAMIAGCERKVLVSPPPINPAILYIADLCGVDEIYQVGGAQAVAALAYGTESIKPVDKIFGPGNRFVTQAKNQIAADNSTTCTIDMPAGPSEVLVIADEQANPSFIASDLLSQAEHGVDSQVILVTTSDRLAFEVDNQIAQYLKQLSRSETAIEALKNSRTVIVNSLKQAVEVSNCYAPEHLIIQTDDASQLVNDIRCAGSVFVGAYSPESAGDYASGTNHVLPTYGYSKSVSSLSLADFQRRFTVQTLNKDGFMNLSDTVIELAIEEQLDAHALAIEVRKQAILQEKT